MMFLFRFENSELPVTEIEFPAVTICSQGLNMENVARAVERDFYDWHKKTQVRCEVTFAWQLSVSHRKVRGLRDTLWRTRCLFIFLKNLTSEQMTQAFWVCKIKLIDSKLD